MRIAVIGRTEILYETCLLLQQQGHEVCFVLTAKEAPEYSKSATDFQELAKSWDIPFFHTAQIDDQVMTTLREMPQIDVGVSVNYTGIVPQELIDLFPIGVLNAHGGDLPRYRGNACQAWAILNGESKVGLCIHKMVGGELDSGDIIARDYFPLSLSTKVTAVYEWMRVRVPELFSDALQLLTENPDFVLERQSTDPADALRCYPRKAEDGRIDWSRSAVEIIRLINACNKPYAGAFCKFGDQELIIWDAELADEEKYLAIPGQITLVGDGYVEVATGDGKVLVNEIEVSGQSMAPDELIQSIRQRLA